MVRPRRADPTTGARKRGTILRRIFALAVLVAVAHEALQPMDETDLFFHLTLGQTILAEHRIPFENRFSFTYPEHPDPDLAWGFQVIVALLHRLGGFEAIVLFKTGLIVLAFALVFVAARRRGAGPVAAGLATLMGLQAAGQRLVERPHLLTFVGLAVLGAGLDWLSERPRRLLLLLGLVAVWANLHAGVFFAPVVTALFAAGLCIEARLGGGPGGVTGTRRAAWVALAATGCAAAALLSPGGLRLPSYLAWHTGLGATRNIEEFRVAELPSDPWFFAMLALVLLVLLGLGARTPWRWALPVVAVAPLAWRSVRFVAEWAILAAPLVGTGLGRAAVWVRAQGEAGRLGSTVATLLARRDLASTMARAALGVGAALLFSGVAAARAGTPLRIGLHPEVVPFDAIAFATREGLRERLFSNLDVGCYLLWEGWPRYRVFQDARLPAYPDEFHRALDDPDDAVFQSVLRRFAVDAALVSDAGVNVRAGAFDPEEWALVHVSPNWRGRGAFVFARRVDRHAATIARHEIPLAPRFRMDEGTTLVPLWRPPARSPVPECEWLRRLARALEAEGDPARALQAEARALAAGCLGPRDEARVRFRLGAERQLAGALREARGHYDRVLEIDPDHADTRVNRGYALLLVDPEAARRDFEHALRVRPGLAAAAEGLRRAKELRRAEGPGRAEGPPPRP